MDEKMELKPDDLDAVNGGYASFAEQKAYIQPLMKKYGVKTVDKLLKVATDEEVRLIRELLYGE